MSPNPTNSIPNFEFEYSRISRRPIVENEFAELSEIEPSTTEGVYVYRHFCIRPAIADLVAALAGLGSDRVVTR